MHLDVEYHEKELGAEDLRIENDWRQKCGGSNCLRKRSCLSKVIQSSQYAISPNEAPISDSEINGKSENLNTIVY